MMGRPEELCKLLGIRFPILLAGMGGIANKDLVAAVTNAGGLGTFGSAMDVKNRTPEELLAELKDIGRRCNGKPFGIDILVHGSDGGVMKKLVNIFADSGAKLFVSGKGFPRSDVINLFHARGVLVASIAGKLSHAVKAVAAGVDFVIVQGHEGGGHTGNVALSVLLPQVVSAVGDKVHVVAGGGIYDARGVASALLCGASGVWIGTRFLLSREAYVPQIYKDNLLKTASEETVVTRAYTGSPMRVVSNPYVIAFNSGKKALEDNSAKIAARAWKDGCWKVHSWDKEAIATHDYEDEVQAYVTGQCVGAIHSVVPAASIVQEMSEGCRKILGQLPFLLPQNGNRFPTKICQLLNIDYPILVSGLGDKSRFRLVSAVSDAGGFGNFGAVIDGKSGIPENVENDLRMLRDRPNQRPFGVHWNVTGSSNSIIPNLISISAEVGAKSFVVNTKFTTSELVHDCHQRGLLVGCIAFGMQDVKTALDSEVDFIVVRGYEGGGRKSKVTLPVFLPQVVDLAGYRVPVIAAGGICDGKGIASALAFGASGVWLGTRFLLTNESDMDPARKIGFLQTEGKNPNVDIKKSETQAVGKSYMNSQATLRINSIEPASMVLKSMIRDTTETIMANKGRISNM